MTVYLGSAHIDEHGNAKGGKAGDQTGRELGTEKWYKHSKGWVVLRPKDREKGHEIACAMSAACANPHIGYDQGQRLTLYQAAKPVGFDPAKVTTDCETDCSALVRVCLAYAGIMVSNFTTANEASVLLASGYFKKMSGDKYTTRSDYLRAGDVLVTASQGHTVVVLNDGALAGADESDDEAPANPVGPDGSVKVTTSGNYHLRETPGILGKDKGVVRSGSSVRVYGKASNGWYGIRVLHTPDGKLLDAKGYISPKALPGLE